MPVGNDNASAFAHLEQRVSYLLERLEASSDQRLRQSRAGRGRAAGHPAPASNASTRTSLRSPTAPAMSARPRRCRWTPDLVDIVKRELSDIRFSQSETDRRTQDSLGDGPQHARPCGRSPGDDRGRSARGARRAAARAAAHRWPACAAPAPECVEPRAKRRGRRCPGSEPPPRTTPAPQASRRSQNPNCQSRRSAGTARRTPREFQSRSPRPCHTAPSCDPRAISEILEPHAAPRALRSRRNCRPIIRWSRYPADRAIVFTVGAHRGFRKRDQRNSAPPRKTRQHRRASSPPRAAPPRPPPPRPVNEKAARGAAKAAAKDRRQSQGEDAPSTITSKIRSLLVGASVVVIVLGTFKMAMTLLDTGRPPPDAADGKFERTPPAPPSRRSNGASPRRLRQQYALDDLADPDRPAVETIASAPESPTQDSAADRVHRPAAAAPPTLASDITGQLQRRAATETRAGAGPLDRATANGIGGRCCAPPR